MDLSGRPTGPVVHRLLLVVAVAAVVGGAALVVGLHGQRPAVEQRTGCWFDSSCDVEPAVLHLERWARFGWTLAGAGLVLATLRSARAVGVLGLALVLLGAAVRPLVLGGTVLPAVLGCDARRTCGADPWWLTDPRYDAGSVAVLAGGGCLVAALLLQLRRR